MARTLPTPTEVSPLISVIADLGKHVRNQRARVGLRIDDAAALCGVSSAVLSRLENGRPVTLDKLMAVLDGLALRLLVVTDIDAEDSEKAVLEVMHDPITHWIRRNATKTADTEVAKRAPTGTRPASEPKSADEPGDPGKK